MATSLIREPTAVSQRISPSRSRRETVEPAPAATREPSWEIATVLTTSSAPLSQRGA